MLMNIMYDCFVDRCFAFIVNNDMTHQMIGILDSNPIVCKKQTLCIGGIIGNSALIHQCF